jgi:hypothetical protein
MVNRLAAWGILVWTALMALGIFVAYQGIGGDCAPLTGDALTACRDDAWARGSFGLGLLVVLWLVVVAALGAVWAVSRPRSNPT